MMNEDSVFDLLGHNVHVQHTNTVIVGDEQFFIYLSNYTCVG